VHDLYLGKGLFESLGQLIGAGGIPRAAAVAAQTLNSKGGLGTLQKLCDGLEVAVAAAGENNVVKTAVLQIEIDGLGTDPAGAIGECMIKSSFGRKNKAAGEACRFLSAVRD